MKNIKEIYEEITISDEWEEERKDANEWFKEEVLEKLVKDDAKSLLMVVDELKEKLGENHDFMPILEDRIEYYHEAHSKLVKLDNVVSKDGLVTILKYFVASLRLYTTAEDLDIIVDNFEVVPK